MNLLNASPAALRKRVMDLEDQVKELRQCLIGGIDVTRRGQDRALRWADAAEKLLQKSKS